MKKTIPFTAEKLEEIARRWPTPFHIYDEAAIRAHARELKAAFAWNKGFHEYFAVKATPNPHLMALLREEGFGSDCSSMAELVLADAVGNRGEDIMFTSNDTPAEEFVKARELGAIINLDDITHLDFLEKACGGLPELLCCRWNPGPLKGGNAIIGKPEEAKYGFTTPQLFEAYATHLRAQGHPDLKLYMECGRCITGPYGYLVSRVLHVKDTYRKYAGLDACMANLMRPALYGAYHHITVPAKMDVPATETYDVTGSLCENNDKFAIGRQLPPLEPGDLLVIHDAGAHGHAMGFQYNGKLRSAELLLRPDGTVKEIRRAETLKDYFATLDFASL